MFNGPNLVRSAHGLIALTNRSYKPEIAINIDLIIHTPLRGNLRLTNLALQGTYASVPCCRLLYPTLHEKPRLKHLAPIRRPHILWPYMNCPFAPLTRSSSKSSA